MVTESHTNSIICYRNEFAIRKNALFSAAALRLKCSSMSIAPSEARRGKFLNLDHQLVTEKYILTTIFGLLDFRIRHR